MDAKASGNIELAKKYLRMAKVSCVIIIVCSTLYYSMVRISATISATPHHQIGTTVLVLTILMMG